SPESPVIDANGAILLPAFVDAHMHLDKTFWGRPWRPHEAGPTVRDRIETERRVRGQLDLAPDVQAERLARQALTRGTLHIRSHAAIDTASGPRNPEGAMAARRRARGAAPTR